MKLVKLYLAIAITLICNALSAQEHEEVLMSNSNLRNLGKIELGLHGINFGYEAVVGRKWTMELAAGAGGGYYIDGDVVHYNFILNRPALFLKAGARWNYNIDKRAIQGRNITNNSANYVGTQLKYSFGQKNLLELSPAFLGEVHWGLQRPLGRNFIFNTHIGLGYLNDTRWNQQKIVPTLGVKFGYVVF